MERKGITVPLRLWGYVLFAFFTMQMTIYIFLTDEYAISQKRKYKQLTNHVRQEFDGNPQALKAIVIGSSLVQYGIECPETLKELVGKEEESMVSLGRLWMYDEKFEELVQTHQLFDFMKEVKPDLVCIQSELLAIEIDFASKDSLIQKSRHNEVVGKFNRQSQRNKYLWKSALNMIVGNQPMNLEEHICLGELFDRSKGEDSLNFKPLKRKVLSYDSHAYAHPKIQELLQLGIKVIVLDIPRPDRVEQITHSEVYQREFLACMDEYKRYLGVEYWAYDGAPIYFSESIDGGHLNKKGRRKYSIWLVDKIISETKVLAHRKEKDTTESVRSTTSKNSEEKEIASPYETTGAF